MDVQLPPTFASTDKVPIVLPYITDVDGGGGDARPGGAGARPGGAGAGAGVSGAGAGVGDGELEQLSFVQ